MVQNAHAKKQPPGASMQDYQESEEDNEHMDIIQDRKNVLK